MFNYTTCRSTGLNRRAGISMAPTREACRVRAREHGVVIFCSKVGFQRGASFWFGIDKELRNEHMLDNDKLMDDLETTFMVRVGYRADTSFHPGGSNSGEKQHIFFAKSRHNHGTHKGSTRGQGTGTRSCHPYHPLPPVMWNHPIVDKDKQTNKGVRQTCMRRELLRTNRQTKVSGRHACVESC